MSDYDPNLFAKTVPLAEYQALVNRAEAAEAKLAAIQRILGKRWDIDASHVLHEIERIVRGERKP